MPFRLPAAALVLASLLPAATAAPITQDSGTLLQPLNVSTSGSVFQVGQTFVAEDLWLQRISFALSGGELGASDYQLSVQLYRATSGGDVIAPVRLAYATVNSISPSTPPVFVNFEFAGTTLFVGQTYLATLSIVPSSGHGELLVAHSNDPSAYGGGALIEYAGAGDFDVCQAAAGALLTNCDLNFKVEPGRIILDPVPGPPQDPGWEWPFPIPGAYDPPIAHGYRYELFGEGAFTKVATPAGFDDLQIVVNGRVIESDLDAEEIFEFGPGIKAFSIIGITPPVDAEDPSAFPTYLDFSGTPERLRMTALVPEPDVRLLSFLGASCLWVFVRTRTKRRPDVGLSTVPKARIQA